MADFTRIPYRFVNKGLSLNRSADLLEPGKFAQLTNMRTVIEGELSVRSGTDRLTQLPALVHSIARLDDPTPFAVNPSIRVFGSAVNLYATGVTGPYPPALHDTGYSGNPLTMIPITPVGAVQPYLYIVDSLRMQKMRNDGVQYPIGLAPPRFPPSAVIGPPMLAVLDNFNYTVTTLSGAWYPVGVQTSLVSLANRVSTTITQILYDSGNTGNALVVLGSMENVNIGAVLVFASTEERVIQDIKLAVANTTIAAISYDNGAGPGACTIQTVDGLGGGTVEDLVAQYLRLQVPVSTLPPGVPRPNPNLPPDLAPFFPQIVPVLNGQTTVAQSFSNVDFPAGCLIQIGGELVRIESATIGKDFLQSFRCTTTGVHVAGEAIQGFVACRVYLFGTRSVGDLVSNNVIQATIAPAVDSSGAQVPTTGGMQSGQGAAIGGGGTGSGGSGGSGTGLTAPVVAPILGTMDFSTVTVVNNPPIGGWAATTTITAITYNVAGIGLQVVFDKQGVWPSIIPPGFSGTIEYTLGLAFKINGTWYASAAIEFWSTRAGSGDDITIPGEISLNWFYNSSWSPLSGYQPQPGETIGVFVVAGDVRNNQPGYSVQERSDISLISYIASGTVPPPPGPTPPPPTTGTFADIALIGSSSIAPDDVFHASVNINQAIESIDSIQILFDVDQTLNDFRHNFYVVEFSTAEILAAFQSTPSFGAPLPTTTFQGQTGLPVLPVPGQIGVPTAAAQASGWIELTWTASQMAKVGVDASRNLSNIQAIAIFVTINAQAVTTTVQLGSVWVRGGSNPDSGSGASYLYCFRFRSTITGEISNPSPPMRASAITPRQQPVTLTAPSLSGDPQVDTVDWFRQGGSLPAMTFVGSSPGATFVDNIADSALLGSDAVSFDHFRPWPTTDLNINGVCSVAGTAVTLVSGGPFNVNWAPGSQIFIDGQPYTLYAQPSSATQLQTVENVGALTNVSFQVFQATVLGAFFPTFWGPYNGFFFSVGDPNNPGQLNWTQPNDPDSTTEANNLFVTNPSEPLINGFMWDGIPYVFSSDNLYRIDPDFGNPNTFRASITPCGRGLWGRWAFCLTPQGIVFLAKDGIYITSGGSPAQSLTDADLYPLFPHDGMAGSVVNGYVPPDMTKQASMRLSYVDGLVYFDYA